MRRCPRWLYHQIHATAQIELVVYVQRVIGALHRGFGDADGDGRDVGDAPLEQLGGEPLREKLGQTFRRRVVDIERHDTGGRHDKTRAIRHANLPFRAITMYLHKGIT